MQIWKKFFFLSQANIFLDPDPHQLEKWDPDPHQNVLDLPHCRFRTKCKKICTSCKGINRFCTIAREPLDCALHEWENIFNTGSGFIQYRYPIFFSRHFFLCRTMLINVHNSVQYRYYLCVNIYCTCF